MRLFYDAAHPEYGYRVAYNREDSSAFARQWPCSSVRGSGGWVFDADDNLVDAYGSADGADGADWLAFCEDCQAYGLEKIAARQRKGIAPARPPHGGYVLYVGGATTAKTDRANGRHYATRSSARRAARRILARYGPLVGTAWIITADGQDTTDNDH